MKSRIAVPELPMSSARSGGAQAVHALPDHVDRGGIVLDDLDAHGANRRHGRQAVLARAGTR